MNSIHTLVSVLGTLLNHCRYRYFSVVCYPSFTRVFCLDFRATQYLYDNGLQKFATWFDYKVWYPLGRPVGTTIYPGMQVTAVWLTKVWLPFWFGFKDWIGTSIPSNVVTMNGWEVSKSLSSSGSNVRAMVRCKPNCVWPGHLGALN